MSDWKYIDEYKSLPSTDYIHCDTRDFYVNCINYNIQYNNSEKIKSKIDSGNEFKLEEILPILKSLETRSGGKGEWRMITTKSHPSWLKYIRFVKIKDNVYRAYTGYDDNIETLTRNLLINEEINQEYLNHI